MQTVATVCMFLAGKVEETPRPLKDVIVVSYEIIHKKDSTAPQRIRQQKVFYHAAFTYISLFSYSDVYYEYCCHLPHCLLSPVHQIPFGFFTCPKQNIIQGFDI